MDLHDNAAGQYRFIPGGMPYSWGVIARPGHEIVGVQLTRPVPYAEGFALIDRFLESRERPAAALCAVELRSPGGFSIDGFAAFNEAYREQLAARGLLLGEHNPVARTNVVPVTGGPDEVAISGFSVTAAATDEPDPTFVVAGGAEFRDSRRDADAIIRRGETTPEAMADKCAYVLDLMERRAGALGRTLDDVSVCNVYCAQPLYTLLPTILDRVPGTATAGVRWVYARPPIVELEFEMDVRHVRQELRLGV